MYGTHLLGALVVALIDLFMANRVERITRRAFLAAPHMDPTVGAFLSNLAYYAVLYADLGDKSEPSGIYQ